MLGTDTNGIKDGKGNWNLIALGLLSLTAVSLFYSIKSNRTTIKLNEIQHKAIQEDIVELKMNIKKVLGNKYEPII